MAVLIEESAAGHLRADPRAKRPAHPTPSKISQERTRGFRDEEIVNGVAPALSTEAAEWMLGPVPKDRARIRGRSGTSLWRKTSLFLLIPYMLFSGKLGAADSRADKPLQVPSVLVRLIEEADVPAREAGVLKSIVVREGQQVAEGQLVAELDDREARLAMSRAELELELARLGAANDVSVRFSQKSHEVAKAEHARALESESKYPSSVSQSELSQLQLAAERAELEIEQAEHQLQLARVAERLRTNELDAARWQVEKLRIAAPISGVVAQVHRRRGEWVLPGEKVMRIVRTDRLRAEAFVDADSAARLSPGLSVSLTAASADNPHGHFAGQLVFVSPEVDPVNRQVRIWAEIENPAGILRPGVLAAMTIGGVPKSGGDAGSHAQTAP